MRTLFALLLFIYCQPVFAQWLHRPAFIALVNRTAGAALEPSANYSSKLYAYYTCGDATSSSTISDSSGNARHLTKIGSLNVTSIAGKIDNALSMGGGAFSTSFEGATANWDAQSFVVRCWVYNAGGWSGEPFLGMYQCQANFNTSTSLDVELRTDDCFVISATASSATISLSAWHRVVYWYDAGAQTISVKVDNGSTVTESLAGGPCVISSPFQVHFMSTTHYVDEICLWRDYIPTSDDLLYDWNSGAGRGKP